VKSLIVSDGWDMPKISYNKISKEVEHKIWKALVGVLAKIDNELVVQKFLDDFLTPMEKIMLSKRLMISVLLQQNINIGAICALLKVSKATVNSVKREIIKSGEGYKLVFNKFFTKSKLGNFLLILDKWLDAARLPVKGSGSDMIRWRRAMNNLST